MVPASPPSQTTTTVDRYLESIYCIDGEGEVVRPGRLAAWLGVSAPTVSDAIQRLVRDGWITIAKDRSVTLTEEGHKTASAIVRRHRVLERWLVDVLGFDWATADVEADILASTCSETVIDRLDASMGLPVTCPHGNAIPGREPGYVDLVALADLEPGTPAHVRRISEIAEHEARALLTTLSEHGISQGCVVEVTEDDVGPTMLRIRREGECFELSSDAARWIWVEPA